MLQPQRDDEKMRFAAPQSTQSANGLLVAGVNPLAFHIAIFRCAEGFGTTVEPKERWQRGPHWRQAFVAFMLVVPTMGFAVAAYSFLPSRLIETYIVRFQRFGEAIY